MKNQNQDNSVQTTLTSVIAASSTTPFLTAFKVTLGIGAAHLLLFFGALTSLALLGLATYTLISWLTA